MLFKKVFKIDILIFKFLLYLYILGRPGEGRDPVAEAISLDPGLRRGDKWVSFLYPT